MFPGQGSQGAGMGVPWRDHPAWSIVTRAEDALGEPLAPLLLAESAADLSRTREAQLALLLTSLVVWEAARDTLPAPVAFTGHSLGQVTALIAAGALTLEDGVRLAARRAELTQAAADGQEGRMAALMGADGDQVSEACAAAPGECWLANDNAPGQIVIAGTVSGVERATKAASEAGVRRIIPLSVGGAFHTPLMQEAADGLADILADVHFATPSAPVVSNADAVPYTDGDGWRVRLVEHLVSPVRWRPSMTTLVAELSAGTLVEVGYGSTLSGLAKRCVPGTPVTTIGSPADVPPGPEVG
ncbi:MAG: ACP S-malonyltransferase [Acidimicrobiia bacterium]